MSERNIPFGRPMLDQTEIDAVTEVLSGPMLVHGKVTHAFEEQFAARIGAAHAVSLSNCTAGLHLMLFASGIGPGDEVIVPAMTHVATAHAVEFCGATPVFADVEADTGNIDPQAVAQAVGENTRALLPVHYLGLPCDMDALAGHRAPGRRQAVRGLRARRRRHLRRSQGRHARRRRGLLLLPGETHDHRRRRHGHDR